MLPVKKTVVDRRCHLKKSKDRNSFVAITRRLIKSPAIPLITGTVTAITKLMRIYSINKAPVLGKCCTCFGYETKTGEVCILVFFLH